MDFDRRYGYYDASFWGTARLLQSYFTVAFIVIELCTGDTCPSIRTKTGEHVTIKVEQIAGHTIYYRQKPPEGQNTIIYQITRNQNTVECVIADWSTMNRRRNGWLDNEDVHDVKIWSRDETDPGGAQFYFFGGYVPCRFTKLPLRSGTIWPEKMGSSELKKSKKLGTRN